MAASVNPLLARDHRYSQVVFAGHEEDGGARMWVTSWYPFIPSDQVCGETHPPNSGNQPQAENALYDEDQHADDDDLQRRSGCDGWVALPLNLRKDLHR